MINLSEYINCNFSFQENTNELHKGKFKLEYYKSMRAGEITIYGDNYEEMVERLLGEIFHAPKKGSFRIVISL